MTYIKEANQSPQPGKGAAEVKWWTPAKSGLAWKGWLGIDHSLASPTPALRASAATGRGVTCLLPTTRCFSMPHSWAKELLTTGCPVCQKSLESTWTNQWRRNLSKTLKCKGVAALFRGSPDTDCWKVGGHARKIALYACNIVNVSYIHVVACCYKRKQGLVLAQTFSYC